MKRYSQITALFLCAIVLPIASSAQHQAQQKAGHKTQAATHCTGNGTYVNKDGQTVKRPENCSVKTSPPDATALCRDGKYSFSKYRSGTCSHHGGVLKWLP
jgi:hypothetical protein